MNYLIVCPPLSQSSNEKTIIPLGIAYVYSSLKEVRDSVYALNLSAKENIEEYIKDVILKNNIGCFAIGGISQNYNIIKKILIYVKKINPKIITIVGGGLVTASPKLAIQGLINADIGIIGEGEYTIQEIADAIDGKRSYSEIRGIIYKDTNGDILQTPLREEIKFLDKLPFPNVDAFLDDTVKFDNILPTIIASRSCPFNCTFCFHTCGKTYRMRSLDNIFDEIDSIVSKHKISIILIQDELFSVNKKRLFEFCDRIKKYNIKWAAQTRVDQLSLDILYKMKDSGCTNISFGIESACDEILKGMKKNITIEQIENAFSMAKKVGLGPRGNILLGDKNETRTSFQKTIEWIKLHPDVDISFARIYILPGSELYEYAVKNGYIKNELDYWAAEFPYINITKMTDAEYDQCLFDIETVYNERIYMPNKCKVIEKNYNCYNVKVEYICNVCNKRQVITKSDFTWMEQNANICEECEEAYRLPLYMLLKDEIDFVLSEYLTKNRLYIYGAGMATNRFLYMCEILRSPKVIIVDSDPVKQGCRHYNVNVYSPDILNNCEVKTIYATTSNFSAISSISTYVEEKFPNIKEVTSFNKLIFDLLNEQSKKIMHIQ